MKIVKMKFTVLFFKIRTARYGSVTLATNEAELHKMRPFGAPLPETLKELEWMTYKQAVKLAKELNVTFIDF